MRSIGFIEAPRWHGLPARVRSIKHRASTELRSSSPPARAGCPCHTIMTRFSLPQFLGTLTLSALLWLAVAFLCLFAGSTGWGWPGGAFRFRAGPVALASLIGAALGAAGVVYQSILRNPLADPYLLGVSSGASLACYLWRVQSIAAAVAIVFGAMSQQAFAFAGALIAVGVVFALAGRRGRLEPLTLLLVGVIVNAVNASS